MLKLASIVLAAGASQRFGPENKLTTLLGGHPLVRLVARAVNSAYLGPMVVVTGNDPTAIEAALDGMSVRFVSNANWARGIGSSIATGISALDKDIDGAFIVPGDMPFLRGDLLRRIAGHFNGPFPPIVYPTTLAGAQRNPVLWPRRYFPTLMELSGSEGGKNLLKGLEREATAVAIDDERVFADVDTAADLDAIQR